MDSVSIELPIRSDYEVDPPPQAHTHHRAPKPRLNPAQAHDLLARFQLDGVAVERAREIERAAIEQARAAADQTEYQFLRTVARLHEAGLITQRQLAEIYPAYRALSGRSGFTSRWDEVLPLKQSMVENDLFFDPDPDGRWRGAWPLQCGTSVPLTGTSVVYYLYDAAGECCYIGSTADMRERLKTHRQQGKKFASWMAEQHESREAAYVAEAALLKAGPLPYLNRRAGR